MRWKFPDPSDAAEERERKATIRKINKWWKDFATKLADLQAFFSRKKKWDVVGWVDSHLKGICPGLGWEFGPAATGGDYLAISAEGTHHLRPLVDAIVSRAPQLEGWTVCCGRPPGTMEWALQAVKSRGGGDLSKTRVRASMGELHRLDLRFQAPTYVRDDDDQQGRHDVFLFIEALLGEEVLDTWVGVVAVGPVESKAKKQMLPLERLQETSTSLIGSVIEQLPERPCFEWIGEATSTVWNLEPTPDNDYAGQDDLLVGSSKVPDIWTAVHDGRSFASVRYSRCGETFCYVKLDGTEPGAEALVRDEIEEALDAALIPAKVGCTIGAGTGLRYSYIDLALTDVSAAIPLIRRVLRKCKVGKRSWLLFFDRDLEEEWVGIWARTPAPPR
jgi:hypothetical protein